MSSMRRSRWRRPAGSLQGEGQVRRERRARLQPVPVLPGLTVRLAEGVVVALRDAGDERPTQKGEALWGAPSPCSTAAGRAWRSPSPARPSTRRDHRGPAQDSRHEAQQLLAAGRVPAIRRPPPGQLVVAANREPLGVAEEGGRGARPHDRVVIASHAREGSLQQRGRQPRDECDQQPGVCELCRVRYRRVLPLTRYDEEGLAGRVCAALVADSGPRAGRAQRRPLLRTDPVGGVAELNPLADLLAHRRQVGHHQPVTNA